MTQSLSPLPELELSSPLSLKIMSNITLPIRGSNVPYTFSPGTNASIATGADSPATAGASQDRLIVGVDFGTTYSGKRPNRIQIDVEQNVDDQQA